MAENPTISMDYEFTTENITVPADGFDLKAYRATPNGDNYRHAIIVLHENRGLVSYLRDVANGLASNGYLAVAPDLLSREGGTYSFTDINKEIPAKLQDIPIDRHSTDVSTLIDHLRDTTQVERIGVIGFCFGGAVTWDLITKRPDIDAAVPCYGSNPDLDQIPNIRSAVCAVYGDGDERVNPGIPAIRSALEASSVRHHIEIYPASLHGFLNHRNPERYNPATAQAAWSRAIQWFSEYLASAQISD